MAKMTDKELLEYVVAHAADVLYDHDHFEPETEEIITGNARWNTYYEQVMKHVASNRLVRVSWSRGSTEYQDNGLENVEVSLVRPVQKTVTLYEDVAVV